MYDSYLFKRIADSLIDMCAENRIKKITYLEINVHHNSHINSKSLQDYLIEEIPNLVDDDSKIVVDVEDNIEELSALILSIEGYKNE